jgi:NDP-sugar pyrophosphorylase family protein
MQYIDYGLGAISAQILKDENTTGPFDLADVYHRLSLSGQLAGYELHERFYEIGSHKTASRKLRTILKEGESDGVR